MKRKMWKKGILIKLLTIEVRKSRISTISWLRFPGWVPSLPKSDIRTRPAIRITHRIKVHFQRMLRARVTIWFHFCTFPVLLQITFDYSNTARTTILFSKIISDTEIPTFAIIYADYRLKITAHKCRRQWSARTTKRELKSFY